MFEQMPFSEKYPVFRKLAEIGDLRKLSREELELYDEDIKNMRDIYATRKFDEKRGMEKGMANKEKIDYLLLDIRELETLVAGMRDAEVYPVSFFGQTFDLTHKILKDLHALETAQIEMLRKQMEEHQALIQSIPPSVATPVQTVQEASITAPAPIPAEPEPVIQEQEIRQELPAEQGLSAGPEPIPVEEPETPAVETSGKVIPAERPGLFLNDLLEKKNFSDFRKAFSLNDRFRFRRELFGGDEARMNKVINDLNDLHSYEDSVTYLNNELKWNIEDEAVADFIKLLEKRFL